MNSNAVASIETISAESLPAIAWQQARVITTELLAKLYGTEPVRIQQNHARNTDRFVEGTHFFKLEGDALRQFKKSLTISKMVSAVSRNARSLILWTERGAARHAKMLDTEAAWEVFEKLEDCYFRVKEAVQAAFAQNRGDVLTADQAEVLRVAMQQHVGKLPKEKQGAFMVQGWSKLKSHFGVPYRKIPQHELPSALSIIARHAAQWELVGETPALPAPPVNLSNLDALCMHVEFLRSWWNEFEPALRSLSPDVAGMIHDHFVDAVTLARNLAQSAGIKLDNRIKSYPWRSDSYARMRYMAR